MTRALVWLVRSKPIAANALAQFAQADTEVFQHSMIDQQIADGSAIADALEQAKHAQWLIFVSPFAVHAAQILVPELFDPELAAQRQWAVVGTSTALALRELRIDPQWQPPADQEGSAALLARLHKQRWVGQSVAIFAAPDGLQILQESLREAGAMVCVVPVYQRRPYQITSAQLADCAAKFTALTAIQFASALQLEQWQLAFAEALSSHRPNWQSEIIVVVPSERVAILARQLGFAKIRVQSALEDTALARFLLT